MNKIYLGAVLVFSSLYACSDFLDEPLKGDYNSDNIFSNAQQAELAVNAIYNASNYSINLWKFGDVASDDAVKGGNSGDQAEIGYLDNFTANADNGVISEFWQNTYETINRSNNVINGISELKMDETLKKRFLGEAKFLRAYSYFQLVNIFGKVPLKLNPQTKQEYIHIPLSEVNIIYEQIENDLTEAAHALPATYTTVDHGRVTKGAAFALLAKAYLYEKKYSQSLVAIDSVENLNLYELERNYSDLFKLGNESSKESIFAHQFLSEQNPGIGNMLNQWFAPLTESGYYFDAPTQSYVDCFTEKCQNGDDDPRLDASIGRAGKEWLNGDTFDASWSETGYLVKKHNQPLAEVPAGKKGDGGLAYIYLRYADVLLFKAEALNETNHPDLAKIELDKVRDRAGLVSASASSQAQMRDAIRIERRRELGFEFHRFFDLMRWGKEIATAALGENFKWEEPRFYFPIPQSEKDANQAL